MRNDHLTAIDLFSGCGGLSLGLKMAGFKVLAAIEIDRRASETYRLNHPDVRLFSDDIRSVSAADMGESLGLKPGELGLLAGCPPCQGFSRIRTKNGARGNSDPRNDLALAFLEFAQILRPKNLLLENVPGLRRQSIWVTLKAGLVKVGYRLVEEVVDASDYGVPQRRKRLILLGSLDRDPIKPDRCSTRLTVGDALSQVPMDDDLHLLRVNHSEGAMRIIRAVPKNGGSRSDIPDELTLPCHRRINGFGDVYGRMQWDKPAPTITSGCHNPSKGRFVHPFEDRAISLREAAVLQGFPVEYRFLKSHGKEAIALMIGNALPPPMICAHASALRSS
ncbi:DNA cytosine methyltransferase [Pseudoxanthomonas koreensis]|uniref:DNA cytosine methyltransferase n=1 Tax=Pseudoxanthomonas koreensis TaxID=266061 RepID=UPI001391EF1F|nr:DNA cytosine methyltransferase [Pseudoxanthomonas koreensis]KAF1697642.1 DNA (cytosine-5-)-methyltransferase [Pseudoxanthomonas koreensis]